MGHVALPEVTWNQYTRVPLPAKEYIFIALPDGKTGSVFAILITIPLTEKSPE